MKKTSLIVAVLGILCCSCDLDKLDTTAFRVSDRITRLIRVDKIQRVIRSELAAPPICNPDNPECP